MNQHAAQSATGVPVETILCDELAHGDAMLGTIGPILRHLLANDEHSVFGDEIIARVRGAMADLAGQLLDEVAIASNRGDDREHDPEQIAGLVARFVAHPGFLQHIHALALEWQLTERLHARLGLDPVLSPLLQALIASSEGAIAAGGMALLAAQARFAQAQRRMKHPLGELPGDLLHAALLALRTLDDGEPETADRLAAAEAQIRLRYDESRSRLGLAARLVVAMGAGATAALSIPHAGVCLFASALAVASGQDRDMAVLATNEGQLARLALSLRAAGLKPTAVEEQFVALHPDVTLPEGFDQIGADRAAALLARGAAFAGG